MADPFGGGGSTDIHLSVKLGDIIVVGKLVNILHTLQKVQIFKNLINFKGNIWFESLKRYDCDLHNNIL